MDLPRHLGSSAGAAGRATLGLALCAAGLHGQPGGLGEMLVLTMVSGSKVRDPGITAMIVHSMMGCF